MMTKTEQHKIKIELMLTPNRGYPLQDNTFSWRIPHKILIELLGDPFTDKFELEDDEIGYWYIDVNGEPLKVTLIDPDKRLEKQKKTFLNPTREEIIKVYGNGREPTLTSFTSLIFTIYGDLRIREWKNFDRRIEGVFRRVGVDQTAKNIIEIFEKEFKMLYDDFVTSMNDVHNSGQLDKEKNDKILEIEEKVDKLQKMIQKIKTEI